jgi:hypothetical protein
MAKVFLLIKKESNHEMENDLLKAIGLIRRGNAIQAVDGRG